MRYSSPASARPAPSYTLLATFNFPKRVLAGLLGSSCRAVMLTAERRKKGGRGGRGRLKKETGEKRKETTKKRDDGKGWRAETATSDSGKQQRQHDSRWLARHCSLLALYFFLHVPFFLLCLLPVRASERRALPRGFIVFELDASLLCFVSRAIRGANCRSYAIAFCFLLLPPFLLTAPFPFPLPPSLPQPSALHLILVHFSPRRHPNRCQPTATRTAKRGQLQ